MKKDHSKYGMILFILSRGEVGFQPVQQSHKAVQHPPEPVQQPRKAVQHPSEPVQQPRKVVQHPRKPAQQSRNAPLTRATILTEILHDSLLPKPISHFQAEWCDHQYPSDKPA